MKKVILFVMLSCISFTHAHINSLMINLSHFETKVMEFNFTDSTHDNITKFLIDNLEDLLDIAEDAVDGNERFNQEQQNKFNAICVRIRNHVDNQTDLYEATIEDPMFQFITHSLIKNLQPRVQIIQ